MPTPSTPTPSVTHRVSGPAELIEAIPYLLRFHPTQSLVLVGLDRGLLVVTARLDLDDALNPGLIRTTIAALHRGGSRAFVAVVFDDTHEPTAFGGNLPWAEVVDVVELAAAERGAPLDYALLLSGSRWWAYGFDSPAWCPPEGWPLPSAPSAFAAAATYEGVVALPDRAALAASLDQLPSPDLDRLRPLVEAAEHAGVAAALDGSGTQHERAVKRAIFAAARASGEPDWVAPADDVVASFAVALTLLPTRDAVWLAIDSGRLDGRPLWRDLARRAPVPYDTASLFLYGWASWRAGDGALAGIAAERAVGSDPGYSAADLLLAALSHGVDPRTFPVLSGARRRRSDRSGVRGRPRPARPGGAAPRHR